MFYFVMACTTMFIASTVVFTIYNKSKKKDKLDLYMMLLTSLLCSIIWWITIPAAVILGGAWLTAKLFSLDWKSKNESKPHD